MSAQILHESKTKWRVAPKRKTGAAAKHLLDCAALQSQMNHRTMESLNHGTIERKISNRSRMWSAAGHQPAADHDKNTDFVRILLCFHGVKEEREGSKPPFGLLLWVAGNTQRVIRMEWAKD